jgi:RNA-directed DNA polymerase
MPEPIEQQQLFDFERAEHGEPCDASSRLTPPPAILQHESPTDRMTDRLMEKVLSPTNIQEAIERVMGNKGAPGVDGMTVDLLPAHFAMNGAAIAASLLAMKYKPQPVKRHRIPKDNGGTRDLGIPTVTDRVIQQALLQILQPIYDPTFSDSSYGFRPKRSAHQAIRRAQEYIQAGKDWVVDIDLEKFFDRVNHDVLMSHVAKRIADKRILKLIRAFLNAGVMDDGLMTPSVEGTPQGGPLSPLLSNILLDNLDRELTARGHQFVRYADDCNIYVSSERAGKRVKEKMTKFLLTRLRLKVNESKSAVARPWDRKFLGFSFNHRNGKITKKVAPRSAKKLKEKIRDMTPRKGHQTFKQVMNRLALYLRGWIGYFGIVDDKNNLKNLDSWTRHRLRTMCWFRWKTSGKRIAEMVKRGVVLIQARRAASSGCNAWRMGGSPQMHTALGNAWFGKAGLPSLFTIAQSKTV